ncbi:MAG: hypothetical protein ACOH1T_09490 [Microbacteriaceae bacterium]
MYSFIWKLLPGPMWLRVVLAVGLIAAVFTALVIWVFPIVDQWITNEEVTIDE